MALLLKLFYSHFEGMLGINKMHVPLGEKTLIVHLEMEKLLCPLKNITPMTWIKLLLGGLGIMVL